MATEVSALLRRAAVWLDRASVENIDMPLNPAARAVHGLFTMLTFVFFRSVRGICYPWNMSWTNSSISINNLQQNLPRPAVRTG